MEDPSIARSAPIGATQPVEHDATDRSALVAPQLQCNAILFDGDKRVTARRLSLKPPERDDVVVDVEWSGVSTGTERLMWSGDMPGFPGMGYPLVPGYEAVGRVIWAGARDDLLGRRVFVPGAQCYQDAHGLFGAASSRIIAPASRVAAADLDDPQQGVLLALAATAYHAIVDGAPPDLIVGHGVLGRLLARVTLAVGAPAPNVWEINPERADADGYAVFDPDCDGRADYGAIYDVSGDCRVIDKLIAHSRPRGEIVLAGFYADRPSFGFPPAFMKEIRIRIAAEWKRDDLDAVLALVESGALSLDGLITHCRDADEAPQAYRTAFEDPACLKMTLDWRSAHGAV